MSLDPLQIGDNYQGLKIEKWKVQALLYFFRIILASKKKELTNYSRKLNIKGLFLVIL